MFVVVDVEWVEHGKGFSKGFSELTQIAALRVDTQWNVQDTFSALVQPSKKWVHDVDHIAYSGYAFQDFKKAEWIGDVQKRFQAWLRQDDTVCVWHEDSAALLKKLLNRSGDFLTDEKMIVLKSYMRACTYENYPAKGNAYRQLEAWGVPEHTTEHCSVNDVQAICHLMQVCGISTEDVRTRQIVIAARSGAHLAFQLDVENGVIHKKGCAALMGVVNLKGFARFRTGIANGHQACSQCCKGELLQYRRENNRRILNKTECVYAYTPDSDRFHVKDCSRLLAAKEVRSVMYYHTCINDGRLPCRICKPDRYRWGRHETEKRYLEVSVTREQRYAMERFEEAHADRLRMEKEPGMIRREDMLKLTNSRYAFWAAKGYETFHLRNCPKLARLEDIQGFARYDDARKRGYHPCPCCKPTKKADILMTVPMFSRAKENERIEDIEDRCRRLGYTCVYRNPEFYIETEVGKWIMNTGRRPVVLEHINLVVNRNDTQYHLQPTMLLSLDDAISYIHNHDEELLQKTKRSVI